MSITIRRCLNKIGLFHFNMKFIFHIEINLKWNEWKEIISNLGTAAICRRVEKEAEYH